MSNSNKHCLISIFCCSRIRLIGCDKIDHLKRTQYKHIHDKKLYGDDGGHILFICDVISVVSNVEMKNYEYASDRCAQCQNRSLMSNADNSLRCTYGAVRTARSFVARVGIASVYYEAIEIKSVLVFQFHDELYAVAKVNIVEPKNGVFLTRSKLHKMRECVVPHL